MSRFRFLVLTVGPVIIVGASAAGAWLTSGHPVLPPLNDALSSAPGGAVPTRARTVSDASLERLCRRESARLERLLAQWPGRGDWSLWTSEPFVVCGLMEPELLQQWCDGTIVPAASALWASYFDRRPTSPVTIFLLPDEDAYRDCAAWLFGDADISVFGYYRPNERTLVANMATGGGTLVHELTHALMAFDFPDMPDWFNEGLASLHEQCRFRPDGSGIDGLLNWRLPDLQHEMRADSLRPLEELISGNDFRGELEGLNYAHARYFCLYLQHRGVLEAFYRNFRDHFGDDPSGRRALMRTTVQPSLDAIDARFRRWVLSLRWPADEPAGS